MKSIQEELKAAVSGYMLNERCSPATRVDALNAIDAFFRDNLEEVEVDDYIAASGARLFSTNLRPHRGTITTIICRKPKPEPEMKQVTRETLAVLKEFYEGTPQRTPEGDKAVAEVDRLLRG